MARRKGTRKPSVKGTPIKITGVWDRPLKPPKLTRGQITAREHKDLSTYELKCRIQGLAYQLSDSTEKIERLGHELSGKRKDAKVLREDLDALQGLVEQRR